MGRLRNWDRDLTLGAALLGLLGVVQLHLVVRSRHVHSNTQRLDEGIFDLIELGPDPGLQDPKTRNVSPGVRKHGIGGLQRRNSPGSLSLCL